MWIIRTFSYMELLVSYGEFFTKIRCYMHLFILGYKLYKDKSYTFGPLYPKVCKPTVMLLNLLTLRLEPLVPTLNES